MRMKYVSNTVMAETRIRLLLFASVLKVTLTVTGVASLPPPLKLEANALRARGSAMVVA
jgi:hypothetical protein